MRYEIKFGLYEKQNNGGFDYMNVTRSSHTCRVIRLGLFHDRSLCVEVVQFVVILRG